MKAANIESIRIRTQLTDPHFGNDADPDPQQWSYVSLFVYVFLSKCSLAELQFRKFAVPPFCFAAFLRWPSYIPRYLSLARMTGLRETCAHGHFILDS